MDIKSNEAGVCPFCNRQGTLDYECIEFEGEMAYFKWKCAECGHKGEEWYNMIFAGHNVEDENGDLIDLEFKGGENINEDK